MARRHERRFYYLDDKREMRGEVNRPATRSERERSFRFSEIVSGTTPAPSDALIEALAKAMTAPTSTATFSPASPISPSSSTTI
jgi:hypothetical protein